MTPPAKWFLDREDDSVFVCTSAPGTATSPGRVDRQGIVRDIKTGLVKGKPVLKVRPYSHQCLVILACVHLFHACRFLYCSCDLYSIVLKFKVEYFAHKQPNHMKHGLDCISIKVLKSSSVFRLEGIPAKDQKFLILFWGLEISDP